MNIILFFFFQYFVASGKTFFTRKLLKNMDVMFEDPPKKVIYIYSVWQDIYEEMQNELKDRIVFSQRIPTRNELEQYTERFLVVMDDVQEIIFNSEEVSHFWTKLAHHLGFYCLAIVQNIYFNAKYMRLASINTHVMILLRLSRDLQQVERLGRSLFANSGRFLLDAYLDNMKQSKTAFSYLTIDTSPNCPESTRVRSGIFSDEVTVVYRPVIGDLM